VEYSALQNIYVKYFTKSWKNYCTVEFSAKNIKDFREQYSISQGQLAELTGLSRETISNYESYLQKDTHKIIFHWWKATSKK